MAKKKKKTKPKSIRERITVLEIKIDEDFFNKILSSFEIFVTKLGEISGRLDKMDESITEIKAKIFN